jgi:hypothetical protein
MIPGSNNPPDYNGCKLVLAGQAIYGDAIKDLYRAILKLDSVRGNGTYRRQDIWQAYPNRITRVVKLARPMKIADDYGNGVAVDLYQVMGCDVIEPFGDVDGSFPSHHPDRARPENLQDLIPCLKGIDVKIGLAFDGDADRLSIVTKDGQIIYPDWQLMLFAEDALKRHPGDSFPCLAVVVLNAGTVFGRGRELYSDRQAAKVRTFPQCTTHCHHRWIARLICRRIRFRQFLEHRAASHDAFQRRFGRGRVADLASFRVCHPRQEARGGAAILTITSAC